MIYNLYNNILDQFSFCYKKSICDEKWQCNIQKKSLVAEVIKIGKPSKNETWVYDEGDRKYSFNPSIFVLNNVTIEFHFVFNR